ncbi:permease prefix domain 1-containing protein, partial [Streptomyces albus]
MSTCQPSGDPVAAHAGALGDVLVGPAADRERMVAEFRDGLADATDAYVLEGLPRAEAARRAVREAGTVAQLAPHFQRELTVAQARHTARAA